MGARDRIVRPLQRKYTRHSPFVDRVKVLLSSGAGGDGASTMMSLHSNEFAGPGGGNGGRGGNVMVRCSRRYQDLAHIASLGPRVMAGSGLAGREQLKYGRNGEHLLLELPQGTQIIDVDTNNVVFDLDESGSELILLEGGTGGKGNAMFANRTNHSPKDATRGLPGNTMLAQFELKMIADCGLVGLPNAGKSTVLSAISTSKPRIAPYPFTTIHPLIGKIHDLFGNTCEVADLPGLIEGAYENRGLGHQFLRHVERTHAIMLVVDMVTCYSPDEHRPPEPWEAVNVLLSELEFYQPGLSERVVGILANKMDAEKDPHGRPLRQKVEQLRASFPDIAVFPVSAFIGATKGPEEGGLLPALHHICEGVFARKRAIKEQRQQQREAEARELDAMFSARSARRFNELLHSAAAEEEEEVFSSLPGQQSLVDQQLGDLGSGLGEPLDLDAIGRSDMAQINRRRDRTLRGSAWSLTREPGEKLPSEQWE